MDSKAGHILLLNGSSSSGKTTLALQLQQQLSEPYQHLSLDQFRDGMPNRLRGLNAPADSPGARGLNIVPRLNNGEMVTAIEFGDQGELMLQGMRRAIRAFVDQGINAIVDDLLFKTEYLTDYAQAFAGVDVWCVGVHCSLERVQEREAMRRGRFPGTAESHFEMVHSHGLAYDIVVDTTDDSPKRCAEKIIHGMQKLPTALANWSPT